MPFSIICWRTLAPWHRTCWPSVMAKSRRWMYAFLDVGPTRGDRAIVVGVKMREWWRTRRREGVIAPARTTPHMGRAAAKTYDVD